MSEEAAALMAPATLLALHDQALQGLIQRQGMLIAQSSTEGAK